MLTSSSVFDLKLFHCCSLNSKSIYVILALCCLSHINIYISKAILFDIVCHYYITFVCTLIVSFFLFSFFFNFLSSNEMCEQCLVYLLFLLTELFFSNNNSWMMIASFVRFFLYKSLEPHILMFGLLFF